MAAQLERDAHFLKIPDGDYFVFSSGGHPATSRIEGNGIYGSRLDRKLAVRMAEGRAGIVVRTSRDRKWPGRARRRHAAGEAEEQKCSPAVKGDEFLATMFHKKNVDGARVIQSLQLSGEAAKWSMRAWLIRSGKEQTSCQVCERLTRHGWMN